jgi:ketosteroid isomerase-like protein
MKRYIFSMGLLLATNPIAAQACELNGKDAPLALHKAWIMEGWERKQGDPKFVFTKKMNRYYDLKDISGIYYDNFAPGATQLFRNAAQYGENWQELQNAARSVRHALTGGDDVIVSKDVASTTLGFVGRIDRLDGKVIAFNGRSQLGWFCTDGSWKIHHELNFASVVNPEEIAHYYPPKDAVQ